MSALDQVDKDLRVQSDNKIREAKKALQQSIEKRLNEKWKQYASTKVKIKNAEDEAVKRIKEKTYHNEYRKDDKAIMRHIDDVYDQIRITTKRLPTPPDVFKI